MYNEETEIYINIFIMELPASGRIFRISEMNKCIFFNVSVE